MNAAFATGWCEEGIDDDSFEEPGIGPQDYEAYYDSGRGAYWTRSRRGDWLTLNETGIKRLLKSEGIPDQVIKGESLSPLEEAILDLQLGHNVDYAGPLAGYSDGLYEILESRVLVTKSPKLIEPAAGNWPVINELLNNMFTDEHIDQSVFLMGWLKIAIEALRAREHRPGQALVLAGPSNSGKSLVQKLVTELLGGRMAKPFQYMLGKTQFNAHMFSAEHLVIEDEAASTDIRARREFGAHLKEITVNDYQSCHAKNRQPISLTPFWRLSITVNEEPENLMVLPPIDDSLEDKVILLKAQMKPMPMPTDTDAERQRFRSTLRGELPAFVNSLMEWEIPANLRSDRFGIRHFHHPDLLRAIDDLAPERRLLSIIDSGGLFYGPLASVWEGTAEELERKLLGDDQATVHEVRRLLSFNTACGVYLGRLAKKFPRRVGKRVIHGHTLWAVSPPVGGG